MDAKSLYGFVLALLLFKKRCQVNNLDEVEILLAEDNNNDAELFLRALKKNNLACKTFRVKNGEEALEYIFATGKYMYSRRRFPKIILLDLKLPKVNGLEVLKRIRSDEMTRTIPVVIFTSSQEEKDRFESYKLGSNSFIVKPIISEKFFQTVSEIVLYWLFLNLTAR